MRSKNRSAGEMGKVLKYSINRNDAHKKCVAPKVQRQAISASPGAGRLNIEPEAFDGGRALLHLISANDNIDQLAGYYDYSYDLFDSMRWHGFFLPQSALFNGFFRWRPPPPPPIFAACR